MMGGEGRHSKYVGLSTYGSTSRHEQAETPLNIAHASPSRAHPISYTPSFNQTTSTVCKYSCLLAEMDAASAWSWQFFVAIIPSLITMSSLT